MKPIRTLLIANDFEIPSLWEGEDQYGHETAMLTHMTHAQAMVWGLRCPNIKLISTPQEALEWQPEVAVVTGKGLGRGATFFSQRGIPVCNSSAFHDQLEQDPEKSRNLITTLFTPGASRRFIPLGVSSQHLLEAALWYSLRYPEDQYILDLGDTGNALVSVSAGEILKNLSQFEQLIEESPPLFCHQIGGLMAHKREWPEITFNITGIFGGGWVGKPIINWSNGLDKLAIWAPENNPMFQAYLDVITPVCQANQYRGPITLRCCVSAPDSGSEATLEVFAVAPAMPQWVWFWLRGQINPEQSWASLWKSVAKGASFNYLQGGRDSSWILRTTREAPLQPFASAISGVVRAFQTDWILGPNMFQPHFFNMDTFQGIKAVMEVGLLEKKPLWAALQVNAVERMKGWLAPPPSIVLLPLPPLPTEVAKVAVQVEEPAQPILPQQVKVSPEEPPINWEEHLEQEQVEEQKEEEVLQHG